MKPAPARMLVKAAACHTRRLIAPDTLSKACHTQHRRVSGELAL
jgi:hypothetical protein